MKKVSREQMVNVGSGSGFFFCGPLGDFIDKKDTIESGMYEKCKLQYERAVKELESLEQRNDGSDKFEAAIRKRRICAENAKETLGAFRPLDEREVIDTYKSIADERFRMIIIEGREHGSYWYYAEYLEVNGPREKYKEEVKREKRKREEAKKREGRLSRNSAEYAIPKNSIGEAL